MKPVDLTGERYGRLEVTGPAPPAADGKRQWFCRCACGVENYPVRGASLRRGQTQSCGCLRRETSRAAVLGYAGRNAVDMAGERYGRLRVVQRVGKRDGRWLWECDCACGGKTKATSAQLRTGHKTSCGCARRAATRWPRPLADAVVTAS